MTASSPFRDVLGSTVRTDVLLAVASGSPTTGALKRDVDASESAVYDALGTLEERGLVRSVGDRWETTGSGRLVADLLEQQADLDRLLEDYWRTHDVGALPRRFRLRLGDLADATVFRASDTDPQAAVREVCDWVRRGSPDVDVVSPVYHAEYEDAMPDAAEARLVLDAGMVAEAIDRVGGPDGTTQFEHTSVRVVDVDVAVGVTGDALLLSLPTLDGRYDSRTEVVATDDRALDWGRDLFERYWDRAVPAAEFLARRDL